MTGITIESNKEIYADYIISNMEVIPVYKYLLNFDANQINKLERKFEPASSGYVMHLGVDKSYPELQHHNFSFQVILKLIMIKFFTSMFCLKIRLFM